jgi:hypothetical protein
MLHSDALKDPLVNLSNLTELAARTAPRASADANV